MKNKIFSFIILVSMLLSFNSCGLIKKLSQNDNGENTTIMAGGTQNMYQSTYEYSQWQLDSLCNADNLPNNLNDWINRGYQDYETDAYITRYMYIKELNDNYEMIYIVTPRGEIYVVSKRKVVTEEE